MCKGPEAAKSSSVWPAGSEQVENELSLEMHPRTKSCRILTGTWGTWVSGSAGILVEMEGQVGQSPHWRSCDRMAQSEPWSQQTEF